MTAPIDIFSRTNKSSSLSVLQVNSIVHQALIEDLYEGDLTTDNLPELANKIVTAKINVRDQIVVSGLLLAQETLMAVDHHLHVEVKAENGKSIPAGQCIMTVEGNLASILKAERTALNFIQHLSGIATETRKYVDEVVGTHAKITNTRKTTPGLRLLERQAVVDGGASPHRFSLGSAVMVKDNHLTGISIKEAVRQLRQAISHTQKIEVEADTLEQVEEAVDASADIILLDNMSPDTLRKAIALIDGRVITEASGGISLETVRAVAETGVDYISTSKITLGAPAVDIGLDTE